MKLLSLLIVVLLVGFLVLKQMESGSEQRQKELESQLPEEANFRKVPKTKQDLDEFKDQMNGMMKDLEQERAKALDEVDN